jgi:hypothetical protein
LPTWCWSWLGWGSLWFRYFSRTLLELYNCLQNGLTFPTILQRTENKGSLLQKYILGRTYKLANLVLVLVGLGQPLVPLLFQKFTGTIQLPTKWPQLPHHWPTNSKRRQHPLEVYLRKNVETLSLMQVLGLVEAASGSRFIFLARIAYEMAGR